MPILEKSLEQANADKVRVHEAREKDLDRLGRAITEAGKENISAMKEVASELKELHHAVDRLKGKQ